MGASSQQGAPCWLVFIGISSVLGGVGIKCGVAFNYDTICPHLHQFFKFREVGGWNIFSAGHDGVGSGQVDQQVGRGARLAPNHHPELSPGLKIVEGNRVLLVVPYSPSEAGVYKLVKGELVGVVGEGGRCVSSESCRRMGHQRMDHSLETMLNQELWDQYPLVLKVADRREHLALEDPED